MTKGIWGLLAVPTIVMGLIGCGNRETASTSVTPEQDATYIAQSEPSGAVGVGDARESAKDNDEVVLVGRVGGSAKPFVDGVAAFTVVDPKVPHCADEEGCPTPWDYCCTQNQVKENIAMVKIVDAQSNPVAQDARALLGIKELNMVVVHGVAQRDADGNLVVLADQVFVKE